MNAGALSEMSVAIIGHLVILKGLKTLAFSVPPTLPSVPTSVMRACSRLTKKCSMLPLLQLGEASAHRPFLTYLV